MFSLKNWGYPLYAPKPISRLSNAIEGTPGCVVCIKVMFPRYPARNSFTTPGLKVWVHPAEKCGKIFFIGLLNPREPEPKISADCGPTESVPFNHLNSAKVRSLSLAFQSRRSDASLP